MGSDRSASSTGVFAGGAVTTLVIGVLVGIKYILGFCLITLQARPSSRRFIYTGNLKGCCFLSIGLLFDEAFLRSGYHPVALSLDPNLLKSAVGNDPELEVREAANIMEAPIRAFLATCQSGHWLCLCRRCCGWRSLGRIMQPSRKPCRKPADNSNCWRRGGIPAAASPLELIVLRRNP
jgi:hypothetical protein